MKIFALIISTLLPYWAFSLETGCRFQPKDLNTIGNSMAQMVERENRSLPRSMPVQSNFEISNIGGKTKYTGTFEAFLRPESDDFVSITPIPIMGFDVSKDRVVIYVCAHYTENPEESHLTIYFLRGYHLDPTKIGTLIGDLFSKPSLQVQSVPAALIGISAIKKFFLQIFRYIPFADIYFDTWSGVQRWIATVLGDITGFGIERIEVTDKFFIIASDVNLDNPRDARFKKIFKIKKPDLGPGAEDRDFQGDDESVLDRLMKNQIDVEEQP